MATACRLNKVVSAGSTSITSFALLDDRGTTVNGFGRKVTVTITGAGTHLGRSYETRVVSDNGAGTVVLRDACPFVGA